MTRNSSLNGGDIEFKFEDRGGLYGAAFVLIVLVIAVTAVLFLISAYFAFRSFLLKRLDRTQDARRPITQYPRHDDIRQNSEQIVLASAADVVISPNDGFHSETAEPVMAVPAVVGSSQMVINLEPLDDLPRSSILPHILQRAYTVLGVGASRQQSDDISATPNLRQDEVPTAFQLASVVEDTEQQSNNNYNHTVNSNIYNASFPSRHHASSVDSILPTINSVFGGFPR